MNRAKRVLIIAPHSSYRSPSFLDAAAKLGVEPLFASEGSHSIVNAYAQGLRIDLGDSAGSLRTIVKEATRSPIHGVIGTDDATTELAALVAAHLKLPHNPPSAVRIARRKDLARKALTHFELPVPGYRCIDLRQSLVAQSDRVKFPCVLKPLALSASRGVIRVDNQQQFLDACTRIRRLLQRERADECDMLLAEDFIPGFEVAVEGMLSRGRLEVLTVFDKPDPLDGPYFEESYYITPSRLAEQVLREIKSRTHEACVAYGLCEGPIHAECRINDSGVWVLEVAARTIGGRCAQLLEFGTGQSLEELVMAHALGQTRVVTTPQKGGAGVLMIPIPTAGILRRVEGIVAAECTRYVEEVCILARTGYELVPWPEGSSYLGFIFARAPTPRLAEAALRQAHSCLNFVVAPLWNLRKISNYEPQDFDQIELSA